MIYNQVIYKGYGGDGTDPNNISPSILDVYNNHKRTATLLNDLILLSWSLYHTSLVGSKNSLLFIKDDTDNNSDLDSNTDSTYNDDSDNNGTTETIPFITKHLKERKALDQVVSECRPTTKEQETLKNIKSHKSNQKDVGGGVYRATKNDVDLLKVEQQNRHEKQKHYLFGDDDVNTSKDTVGTINNQVPKTIASDVDTDKGEQLLDKRSTTATTISNKQPVVKTTKTNSTSPPQ